MTVSELGERQLLGRIHARLEASGRPSASVVIGIGDDGAVVAPTRNALTVLTTDAQVEGVHFERRFSAPDDIGYRALAVNLSDLAAMGAEPRWALLSLALPDYLEIAELDGIVDGLAALGAAYKVVVIGGNLTRSPGPVIVDVTAMGEARPRRVLTRSGGRPGDELYVSGTIGGAAAGLEMLRKTAGLMPGAPSTSDPLEAAHTRRVDRGPGFSLADQTCIHRYLRPEPRVRLGIAVAQARAARAAMDLSDGLADAAQQVAEASGCGLELDAEALPIEPGARDWWNANGRDATTSALSGGDDYELLFAAPRSWGGRLRHARSRVADPPLTRIGVLTKDSRTRVLLRDGRREELRRGFEHFRKD